MITLTQKGALCGFEMVQREFEQWMGKIFGQAFTSLPLSQRGPGSRLIGEFEALKQEFEQDMARSYFLPLTMPVQDNDNYVKDDEMVKLDG